MNFKECMDSLTEQYFKALLPLEEYCEYIVAYSEYSVEDIVVVHADLGNHRMIQMVVCPKSCVINGCGILDPEYFIALEEVHDEHGSFKGWQIIFDVPDKMKCKRSFYDEECIDGV